MPGLSAHPPQPRAPPACKRCSVNKKKCDRMVPRCTGCVLADAPCEPVIKASDKRLMRQMEEMREEAAALKRQVAELQQEMQRRDATGPSSTVSVPSQPSGSSLPALPLLFMTSNEHPVMSPKTRHVGPLHYIFTAFNLEDVDCSDGVDHPNLQPWTTIHDPSSRSTHNELLPTVDEVLRTIQSLAEASKHGPSNLDKIISLSQLQEDCRVVYGPDGLQDPQYAGSRFRCFVTVHLAMSMTAAANAEDITVDPCALACLTTGFKELPSVTEKADFTCVESLTLLSELSIHARIGLNLWQLLGAATRTAAAINLHRRDDVYLPTVFGLAYSESQNSAEIAAHNQRRRDLFWALYSLDRLAAFILNRPPSLADADIDVDLPPATMWPEGKYATLSSEALWTHHIQSRRLYGQIQNALDARARKSNDDGEMSAQEVINGYMQQVQQWYMKSRFNSTVIPFTEESVKRHVLDDIQYHQMVISLHQPSGLVPDISSTSLATLYRSATLSVGLFHHAASRKQLNIHWVNLHQAFTSCATLIYCVRQHQVRADLKAPPEEKVVAIMAQCREVISLFGGVGPSVQQYKTLLAILIEAFQAQRPSPATPSDISRDSLAENSPAVINQLSPSSGMDFAMGMTFNPEMFPGIAEGAFLDGPSNILSPTYWMDNGQVGPERGVESTSSGGSRAEETSISSGAHNT